MSGSRHGRDTWISDCKSQRGRKCYANPDRRYCRWGGAIADGAAIANPDTEITATEEQARAFIFDPGVELSSVVDALNAVGGSPSDLVAILEALREAGSLRAELIVI